jgi:perosamine synthetase
LKLIEDAACAIGSSYKGKKIGAHSDLVCFSFHPRKVISTGDGGMITTSNPEYASRFKILRQHGMSVNDRIRHESKSIIFEDHLELGYNYRMTDIQAAIGIKQLEKLDWIINERRKIASFYIERLKDVKCLRLPVEREGYFSNYQSFSIYLKNDCPINRNELMERLLRMGISTRHGIMTAHRTSAYRNSSSDVKLPISEKASDNSIIIPLYVPMEHSVMETIVDSILLAIKR